MQERIAVEPEKHEDWLGNEEKTASRTSRANSLKVNKHKNYFILVIVWMIVVQSVNIIV